MKRSAIELATNGISAVGSLYFHEKMAWSRTYDIPYFLIGKDRKLRVTALLQFLEDMAIRHSEFCGVGLDYYHDNGVAWVLAKWDVEIYSYPEFNQQITITTVPTSFRSYFGFRLLEVRSEEGELLAKAHTLWVFVDTVRKKPIPVTDELVRAYGLTRDQKAPLAIEAPTPPESEEMAAQFEVRPADIDTNRHVNNIRFVEWALDTLPVDFTESHSVRRVLVDYRKEITFGEQVTANADMLRSDEMITTRHQISGTKKTASLITFKWT
jgi:medium-chain acyl-[acyl-carrier-protein] hydrolase